MSTPRILVIKHGALGDVIQAEGAFHDIRANFPDARIAVLTTPAYRRIFERCPWVDVVLVDPRTPRWRLDAMWALRRRLRAEGFERVFDLQVQRRTAFYRRWMLPDVPWIGRRPPEGEAIPAIDRFAAQLADAGLTIRHSRRPDVGWMANNASAILDRAGVRAPYIVLIPTSSAAHKQWPHFAALAERLVAAGRTVVTVPGPGEIDACRAIPGVTLLDADGRWLSFFQLAGVLRSAAFVVGNDTGPTHMASHLGVPGLALFGPHMAARLTGVEAGAVRAIEVTDLAALPPDHVFQRMTAMLATEAPATARPASDQ